MPDIDHLWLSRPGYLVAALGALVAFLSPPAGESPLRVAVIAAAAGALVLAVVVVHGWASIDRRRWATVPLIIVGAALTVALLATDPGARAPATLGLLAMTVGGYLEHIRPTRPA